MQRAAGGGGGDAGRVRAGSRGASAGSKPRLTVGQRSPQAKMCLSAVNEEGAQQAGTEARKTGASAQPMATRRLSIAGRPQRRRRSQPPGHPPVGDVAQVAQQVGAQRKHLVGHHAAGPHLAQVGHLFAAGRGRGGGGGCGGGMEGSGGGGGSLGTGVTEVAVPAAGLCNQQRQPEAAAGAVLALRVGWPGAPRQLQVASATLAARASWRRALAVLAARRTPRREGGHPPQQVAVVQARLTAPALRLVHPFQRVQLGGVDAPLKVRPEGG